MPSIRKNQEEVDYLVIGAGSAGLSLALKLAERGRVLVLTKGRLEENTSRWAQGGIAAVLSSSDSFASHSRDTTLAGAGLCHEKIVDMVIHDAPRVIEGLRRIGMRFSTDASGADLLHLTREGGHSERRVAHAEDATGRELMRALGEAVRRNDNIEVRTDQLVVDLITTDKCAPDFARNRCLGAYVFDRDHDEIYFVRSAYTVIATGGHGKIYLYTSNPDLATGDGVAMAWRAGCRIANLEFMQFHPTCLYHPYAKNYLISEAVRGEGGEILNLRGEAFVARHHPDGAMAPRDIVARAIDAELKSSGASHVLLDATRIGRDRILQQFPKIHQRCLEVGIDITTEPIPVVPAAHYSCGGIVVDENGQTNIEGLLAIGEVACTGLHGANRLASNSLLESLVFGHRVGEFLGAKPIAEGPAVVVPYWNRGKAVPPDSLGLLLDAWDEIRRVMWHYVGIVRSDERLSLALDRLSRINIEIDRYYWKYDVTERLLEVRNLAQVALLTVRCAMMRKESRGIHYTIDYPEMDKRFPPKDTIIW